MTTIFVSHALEDAVCAETIRQSLEAKGYTVWREPPSLTLESILYPRTIENSIMGSAAIVLVWSSRAAQSEWVERCIVFAQRLKKPIFPILLNGSTLPNTLIVDITITGQTPCTDVITPLITQPHFPPPQSTDLLVGLSQKVAHEFIDIRKEAIGQAADMLKQNEHREEVLAILEYLARHDLMMGVRDKAQEVLDADTKRVPLVLPDSRDSRHIFRVRCRKCGHITDFDKRVVCSLNQDRWREVKKRTGAELDILKLSCEQCGEEMFVPVDCEGYK